MYKFASIPFFLFVLAFGYFYPDSKELQRNWDIAWFLLHDAMVIFLLWAVLKYKFPKGDDEEYSIKLLIGWFLLQMGYMVAKYYGYHVGVFKWAIISTVFFTINSIISLWVNFKMFIKFIRSLWAK